MYKYIIFDVDGTMIDTEKAVIYSYQSVIFKEFGRYYTDEELMKGYGVPTTQALANFGFKDVEKAERDYYQYLIEGFGKCTTFDGVMDVVNTLKDKNYPMGIVTSRCDYEIVNDPCLQKFINKFGCTVCSEDTTLHKPNPDPLLKAMERMNANPEETIYIGDTLYDRKCAKSAGVKFALALWGSNNADNIDADYFLEKPSDLLKII